MGRKAAKPKRTDDSDDDAPKRKRGQASNFKGARFEFLTSKIPEYIAASQKKSGKEAKTEGLAAFWPQLFAEYWALFPWNLPLDQDPNPSAAPAPEPQTVEEAEEALNPTILSPEESERKSKIQKDIKGVGSHFSISRQKTSLIDRAENQEMVLLPAVERHWDPREPVLRISGALASGGVRRSSKTHSGFPFLHASSGFQGRGDGEV